MRHGDDQALILEQAADWIVAASEPDFCPDQQKAFALWRSADDRHEMACRQLEAVWSDIPAALAGSRSPIAHNDDEQASPRRIRRFAGPILALCAVAASAAIFLLPIDLSRSVPQHFDTKVAQISRVELDDGSVATLAPETAITVELGKSERRLRLVRGEAFFEIAKDSSRPFFVSTDNSRIRVVGTSFNVENDGGRTRVAVLHGTVQIFPGLGDRKSPPLQTLTRGGLAEVVSVSDNAVELRNVQFTDNIGKFDALLTGWREGWLAYENVSLAEIVRDLNHYYKPGITLADAGIGQLRITASFKASEIAAFMSSTERLFPIDVERAPDAHLTLRSANRPRLTN